MRISIKFLLLLASSSLASAQPLLSTTDSFASSAFCKTYECKLVGKDPITTGLSDFRYAIKGEFPLDVENGPEVLSVIRQNSWVISANFVTGAQDIVFFPKAYHTLLVARLVEVMTGKQPPQALLLQLNTKCQNKTGQEGFVPWPVANKTYRLSCMLSL